MIEKGKNSSNYCKFCGWEFQHDIVQKINENTEPVYCEFCGIELNITSISRREEHNKEKYERVSNSKDNIEKKKRSIVRSISKLTKSRKHSVDVIFEDDDFPKIFKENLIIVISRLIYISIREWEQDNNVSVRRVSLTKSILYTLANKIKYIIDKRPKRKFLQNFCKLTIEEFEDWLRLLQKKLQSNQDYRRHFLTYLLWLTKIVFRLVSDMWEMKNLPKLYATILKDLKNYFFNDGIINENHINNRSHSFSTRVNALTTMDLLNALRNEIEDFIPTTMIIDGRKVQMFHNGQLSWNKLSLILCKYGHRLARIIRNVRNNPEYKIALDELNKWEDNIRTLFGIKADSSINLIETYRSSNEDLPVSSEFKVLNFHPNLRMDYFEEIDTKEKAYWLGFLWADVYIGNRSDISLELSKKDELLIDRFINALGLDPSFKDEFQYQRKTGIKSYIRIRFKCPKMKSDLLNLGYKPPKLKQTQFPFLDSRELDLAFLLGFFDGEGKEGTTNLHLGSKKILDQIKEKFDIPHDVYPDKEGYWYLSLGGKLFNEMMDNYNYSLGRKRRTFRVSLRETFEESITKKELQEMIWSVPMKEICQKYGVYRRIVVNLCDKWNIERPPSHYWHKKKK